MTTAELAQQISRHTSVKDLSSETPAVAQEFIRAINAAVQKFYRIAPAKWMRTEVSHLVPTPSTVSAQVTADSVSLSNAPFTAAMRGCSVLIDGDPSYNEVVSTDQLLNPFLGTTGTKVATVYYDSVTITDFKVQKIVTDPEIRETGVRLTRVEQFDSASFRRQYHAVYAGAGGLRSVGSYPEYYRVQYVGMSNAAAANDAVVQLRLAPMPTTKHVLNFQADIRPGSFALSTLEIPATIPVDDSLAFSTIVPLAEAEMTKSSVWTGDPGMTTRIENAGARAEADIRNLDSEFARPRRRVVTRRGW